MIKQTMPQLGVFEAWRNAARQLLAAQVSPENVHWQDGATQHTLFDEPVACLPSHPANQNLTVPREFLELAKKIIAHRSPDRFSQAYTLLWRLQSNPTLLSNPADAQVHHLLAMAKSVSRDCHKMKAFVRFRELERAGERRQFGAWFEPDHQIMELTGPFFANRFADMDWVISTPQALAIFTRGHLRFAPPVDTRFAVEDTTENLWRTYYANIFNPARLKIKAMESEMPRKYWKNLPEAALITQLIAGAAQRVQNMRDQSPTPSTALLKKIKAPAVVYPVAHNAVASDLNQLRAAASHCTRCPLHCHATQTVCGEGPPAASIMIVGEQPGDHEDIAGKPFVGPAGLILDQALAAAGLNRAAIYVTNAVKHFKFTTRGKRRIHERPNTDEILQCRWWLDQERMLVKPRLIVAMGATAILALTGQAATLKTMRGGIKWGVDGQRILATYHPSAILRNPQEANLIRQHFFADIASIKAHLAPNEKSELSAEKR